MFPDFTVMAADTATALITLLTVVFLAYLFEVARVARALPSDAWGDGMTPRKMFWTLIGITVGLSPGFLILLSAINADGLEGFNAVVSWCAAAVNLIAMIIGMVAHALISDPHAGAISK